MTNKERLLDEGYEDVVIFENPSYEGALIGATYDNEAVYDYNLMIKSLVQEENMSYEDATDFVSCNSSYYHGKGYPVIIYRLE